MKKCISFNNKLKIWTVITLILIVAGMAIFGIFGFNQTVDYGNAYETDITVEQNVQKSGEIVYNSAVDFFNTKGVKYVSYATQKVNNGETVIFKFNENSTIFKDKTELANFNTELKTYLENQLKDIEGGLTVTVESFSTVHTVDNKIGWICLACGIAVLLIFIYTFIFEKLSGALTVLIVGLISAILDFSVIALSRVPSEPFALATVLTSAIIGMVLSVVIVNRSSELLKSEEHKKFSYKEISAKATCASGARFCFVSVAILLASAILIILGPTYLRWLGIQLIIAGFVSVFTAMGWTSVFWSVFKSFKKDRKIKAVSTEEISE